MKTAHKFGCFGALMATLTGCATYITPPGPPTVYVQPAPVRVERPRVSVIVPPAYVAPPAPVAVSLEIRTETDFYEPLSPYGRWEMIPPYGRCWIPSHPEADWRPYCQGRWERTEDGWYWASEEPWAWATYHYGRWDFHAQFGWYWVPHTQWAPAWVSWHRSEGYLGWAPLQPSVRITASAPVEVDVRRIPQRGFVFVEEKRFLEPVRPTTVIVNNTTIVNKTVNITNVKVVNNIVINEGPRTQIIEQASGRKVQAVAVRELRHRDEAAVMARKRDVPPVREEKVRTPSAPARPEPQQNNAVVESEKRARELHQKVQEQSQQAAKHLEQKAQVESEQQARELQKKAQLESQRKAKELERTARLESDQHARALQQKAQEESQRHAKELERKAQAQSEQNAQELQKQAQAESQRKTQELETKAQRQAEQHAAELHQKADERLQKSARNAEKKAQPPGQRRASPKQAENKPSGTNAVERAR